MKSESIVIVALIVALIVLFDALKRLATPIIKHYWAKYQHYKMIEARRKEFYYGLGVLMRKSV
ncbi:hypothetical protein [Nostoc sp.]|uniref:hypothetical protein n=1 Tax=Nostoc sp. TaxID=1180 RepID=UPI002FF8D49B